MKRWLYVTLFFVAIGAIPCMAKEWRVTDGQGGVYSINMSDTYKQEFWSTGYASDKECIFFDKQDLRVLDVESGHTYVLASILLYQNGTATQMMNCYDYDDLAEKRYIVSSIITPYQGSGKNIDFKEWHGRLEIPMTGNAYNMVLTKLLPFAKENSAIQDKNRKTIKQEITDPKNPLFTKYGNIMKNWNKKDWQLIYEDSKNWKVYAKKNSVHYGVGKDPTQIEAELLYQHPTVGNIVYERSYTYTNLTGERRWYVVDRLSSHYLPSGKLFRLYRHELVPEFPDMIKKSDSEQILIGEALLKMVKK